MVGVERHELDEAHLVGMRPGEAREGEHLVLGEAAQRDGVDLDRVRLGELREDLEAAQDARQGVAACHLEEAVALERVDRDVEAVDPRPDQRVGVALKQEAVRGDAQVVDQRREHRSQPRELAAHERLATGQPQVADAHRGEQRDQPLDLLEREHLGSLEPRQPLGRHAVLATEVAAVGDRDAEVADEPAVAVAQRLHVGQATGHDHRASRCHLQP